MACKGCKIVPRLSDELEVARRRVVELELEIESLKHDDGPRLGRRLGEMVADLSAQGQLSVAMSHIADLRRALERCRMMFAPDMQIEEWYGILADLTGVAYEILLPPTPKGD